MWFLMHELALDSHFGQGSKRPVFEGGLLGLGKRCIAVLLRDPGRLRQESEAQVPRHVGL